MIREIEPNEVDWASLTSGIIDWWSDADFDFPWRDESPEWMGLVTEVLLQRTRASAVRDLYRNFFEEYSTPDALANASPEQIEESIYSLGLLWRSKYLHQLGVAIAETRGDVPKERSAIQDLPGVGPYVSGAFIALHRNQHAAFVDANVVRLLGRYIGFEWDGETRRKRWFLDLAERLFIHEYEPREFGYGLLDFTREVCSRSPQCESCPAGIREKCAFYRADYGDVTI